MSEFGVKITRRGGDEVGADHIHVSHTGGTYAETHGAETGMATE